MQGARELFDRIGLLQQLEAEQIAKFKESKSIPDFRPGDTLRVGVKVVEDEVKLAQYLHKGLSENGHVVDLAHDGIEGRRLATGGDYDLVLLDVTSFGLTGRQAESALLDAGIVTNRNAVPADPNGAWYTSGIRFGTPALTTRGFGADDFDRVAELVCVLLRTSSRY